MYLCEFNKGIELISNNIGGRLIDTVTVFIVYDKSILKGLIEIILEYLSTFNWIKSFDCRFCFFQILRLVHVEQFLGYFWSGRKVEDFCLFDLLNDTNYLRSSDMMSLVKNDKIKAAQVVLVLNNGYIGR